MRIVAIARCTVFTTRQSAGKRVVALLAGLAVCGQTLSGCVTERTTKGAIPTARKVSVLGPEHQAASTLPGYGFADGQLIIKFKREAAELAAELASQETTRIAFGTISLDRLFRKYRASRLQPMSQSKGDKRGPYLLMLAPDANVIRAAEEFSAHPLVEYAEPNYELVIQPGVR